MAALTPIPPTESTPLKIVRLDGIHAQSPVFSIPHTYTEYPMTPSDDSITATRIADSDIAITTRVPITSAILTACPNLKMVAVLAIGTDMVDLAACKERGVVVTNVPAASNEAVAEHAIAFYFALRRNIVGMHGALVDGVGKNGVKGGLWIERKSLAPLWGGLPRTCSEETLCILGGGELGTRVANHARALGMTVILADRKGVPSAAVRPGRTEFTTALKTATVIILTLPLSPSTSNLISRAELALMRPDALLINVSRGGIVSEADLVLALKEKRIAGAATDVFIEEPAGRENVLVNAVEEFRAGKYGEGMEGRLVLTPHVAWFARASIEKLRGTVTANVEAWARGEAQNLVVV